MTMMLGRSLARERTLRLVAAAAATDAELLTIGPTGVGKGLYARRIHEQSAAASRPVAAVNRSALPRDPFENESFGHVAGAFHGARPHAPGLKAGRSFSTTLGPRTSQTFEPCDRPTPHETGHRSPKPSPLWTPQHKEATRMQEAASSPVIASATGFLTVLSALSTAVQQLVDHVIKKRSHWLDTPTPDNPANESRRASAVHLATFAVGTLLSWSIGLEPLQYLGLPSKGQAINALLAGVMISFGSSFFNEALGAIREFKKAQETASTKT